MKLFETIAGMQADADPQEGDLAVVYREEIQPVTEESEFDSCTFPNTVVLDEAFSGEIYGSFRTVDQSVMFDGMMEMSSTAFRFDGYGDNGEIRVEYESEDGITYTRTDSGEELQEFGTTIKYESYGDPFPEVIGNFIKIGGNYFDGIYKFNNNLINKNYIKFLTYSSYEFDLGDEPVVNNFNYLDFIFNVDKILSLINKVATEVGIWTNDIGLTASSDGRLQLSGGYQNTSSDPHHYTSGGTIYTLNNNKEITGFNGNYWTTILNLDDQTYTAFTYDTLQITPYTGIIRIQQDSTSGGLKMYNTQYVSYRYNNTTIYMQTQKISPYKIEQKYVNTGSNLDATPDYVYEKTFYGKNGVENGTLGTTVSTAFNDVSAEIYAKAQIVYNDMTPRVLTDQDKSVDTNIYIIPMKSDGTSLLDTSNVTDMYMMFSRCSNLTSIPLLDTSNVTNMVNMFNGCSNLTSIPLLDTSNVTNMVNMFCDCSSLTTIPLLNTSNVTDMQGMFDGCTSLTSIPLLDTKKVNTMSGMFHSCSSLTTIPLLDTSNVTDMYMMFSRCSNLTTIPLLNTSNVTNVGNMFHGCSSLNNESLNNILAMCANAVKKTTSKTLKYIGLTEEQANICKTLSNYSAFIAAGWTTGY